MTDITNTLLFAAFTLVFIDLLALERASAGLRRLLAGTTTLGAGIIALWAAGVTFSAPLAGTPLVVISAIAKYSAFATGAAYVVTLVIWFGRVASGRGEEWDGYRSALPASQAEE